MKRPVRKIISCMFLCLLVSATVCANKLQETEEMNVHNITLWQLIDVLIKQPSLSPEKLNQVLMVEFLEKNRNVNFSFNEGGPLRLADQVEIKNIDLRFKHKNETEGLLALDLASTGSCVTRDDVFMHYPDLVLIDIPRGRSLDEKAYWTTYPSWGELSFGFNERNPGCLASVVIDRFGPPPPPIHPEMKR